MKKFPKAYEESSEKFKGSRRYNTPLHHYALTAALDTMKAWRLQEENIQCYTAYKEVNGAAKTLGFVHFVEGIVNSKPVVYISHAGVSEQGKGIGRRLMECVLGHYPTGTTFYILTRVFNEEAKTLYKNRLKFEDISLSEIKQLGYDERYCGYKLTSSEALVEDIEQRKAYHQSAPKLGL